MFGKKLTNKQKARINNEFEAFKNKEYSEEDMNKIFENEETISEKMMDEHLKEFNEYIKLFFCMLKDFATRKYTEAPIGTIIAIVATLLYILNPFDIIPDFIPVAGYLDDASIIAICLKTIKDDIDKYKAYREACAWTQTTGTV